MFLNTDDLRITGLRPLIPPAILIEDLPVSKEAAYTVATARKQVEDIVAGRDDRLLVVSGPCSIHDPVAALEYAGRLKACADRLRDTLCIIMRVYFEKPRTTVGWKGFINDPTLDGEFKINHGLRLARQLLLDLATMGMPAGSEFLDTITPSLSPISFPGAPLGRVPRRVRCTASWLQGCRCRWVSKTALVAPFRLPSTGFGLHATRTTFCR